MRFQAQLFEFIESYMKEFHFLRLGICARLTVTSAFRTIVDVATVRYVYVPIQVDINWLGRSGMLSCFGSYWSGSLGTVRNRS